MIFFNVKGLGANCGFVICRLLFYITLQILKIFQFLYRYLPLKLNKEENETLQIKIE